MKKVISLLLLAALMVLCFASCSGDSKDFKIGVILIGDEGEGYTKAHMDGIKAAVAALGLNESQILWRKSVPETADCSNAAEDLVDKGCGLVISNSFGHQNYMQEVAEKHSDVTFIAMTGNYAAISGIPNFCNAFTKIYESRYVSGVVAGMKIKQLIEEEKLKDDNYDADGNVKVGYVGAYPYEEVVSGYTAFYLGIKSVVSNVVMDVQYTSEWFHYDYEQSAASLLINKGCVIIGQHADSEGAPGACEKALKDGKVVYSVGYNVDMLTNAPTAALTSATNNWKVYYQYAIKKVMDGEKLDQNWAKGYSDGAVDITKLGTSVAPGTQEAVDAAVKGIKDGTIKVFDTNNFTVGGEKVTSNIVDLSYINFATGEVVFEGQKVETVVDGAVVESHFRSAPYFSLRIDGITELNAD